MEAMRQLLEIPSSCRRARSRRPRGHRQCAPIQFFDSIDGSRINIRRVDDGLASDSAAEPPRFSLFGCNLRSQQNSLESAEAPTIQAGKCSPCLVDKVDTGSSCLTTDNLRTKAAGVADMSSALINVSRTAQQYSEENKVIREPFGVVPVDKHLGRIIVRSDDCSDGLGSIQDGQLVDEFLKNSSSSIGESNSREVGRGKRMRKHKVRFEELSLPAKSVRKVRRMKIMRSLGLAAPVGSPFTLARRRWT